MELKVLNISEYERHENVKSPLIMQIAGFPSGEENLWKQEKKEGLGAKAILLPFLLLPPSPIYFDMKVPFSSSRLLGN